MSLQSFFSYWFWPNPGHVPYGSTKVMTILVVCGVLVLAALLLSLWRSRLKNPMTKSLTAGWPTAALSFGIVGDLLAVSRVETIQFLSMRVLWVIWALVLALYAALQIWKFRTRHYVVLERQKVMDVRDKYLPGKRR